MKQICITTLCLLSIVAQAQNNGVLGNWSNPTGSTIQVYRCDANVCARLISIRKNAPSSVDWKNPNVALRTRPLCGLQIGMNFHLANSSRAEGGQLYDPVSGRTYSGMITRDGDKLKLRGYVGISLFGRTETWTQAPANITPCHP